MIVRAGNQVRGEAPSPVMDNARDKKVAPTEHLARTVARSARSVQSAPNVRSAPSVQNAVPTHLQKRMPRPAARMLRRRGNSEGVQSLGVDVPELSAPVLVVSDQVLATVRVVRGNCSHPPTTAMPRLRS
jgi:hypothetical protein